MRLDADVSEDIRTRLLSASFPVRLEEPEPEPVKVRVQGIEYRIGNITVLGFQSARLSDLCRRRWRNRLPPPGAPVTFIPAETDRMETAVRWAVRPLTTV